MRPRLAVLLAAGRGKRLRPYTDTTPKPLLPVKGRPTLDFTLQAAVQAGVKQVVFVIGHLGDQIVEYIGDGSAWGIKPYFCEQKELLGTAHALKIAIDAHPQLFENTGSFILTATDYLFEPTVLSELVEKQASTAANIVVSLKEVPKEELSGRSSVRYTGDFEIQEIVEKPAVGQAPSPYSGSLTFLLPSQVVSYIPAMQMSERGEYEIQAVVNRMIAEGFSAGGVLQGAPIEWHENLR
ncbi:MAG: nucleotidyltransferase family protein [Chloroflexota bacterium]